MKRRADSISDATIRERALVDVSGHIIGDYPQNGGRVLLIHVANDTEVEIHRTVGGAP